MFRSHNEFIDRHPVTVCVLLFLALFFLRSLVTFPIEHVDSVHKYVAAADIVRERSLEPMLRNQHTMRWSEVLPQVIVSWATRLQTH